MKTIELILQTEDIIHCWVEAWGGPENVYVAFSGGKDSSVLLHIARRLYPDIVGVFSNTGLEYSEIVDQVKNTPNITILRPKKPFHKVIQDYGWPVVSKKVARFTNDCQRSNPNNQNTVNLRLTGVTSAGKQAPSQKLSKKWRHLIDAPFKVSERCCDYLKKQPLDTYSKETGKRPMIGVMRCESTMRDLQVLKHTCNMYDIKKPVSMPLAYWTDEHIWTYIRTFNLPYASVYDRGEKRTGCVFCMFGISYDRDRFIRLKKNSPKQWEYVIHKLGAKEVLDFLDIPTGE